MHTLLDRKRTQLQNPALNQLPSLCLVAQPSPLINDNDHSLPAPGHSQAHVPVALTGHAHLPFPQSFPSRLKSSSATCGTFYKKKLLH